MMNINQQLFIKKIFRNFFYLKLLLMKNKQIINKKNKQIVNKKKINKLLIKK